jgi:hypothetical protein
MAAVPWIVTSLWLLAAPAAAAQTLDAGEPGTLQIAVRDLTDAAVVGAEVALGAPDGRMTTIAADDRGEATFTGLVPGAYAVTITSPGFDLLELSGVGIASGARVRRVVELKIPGIVERVEVQPNPSERRLRDASTSRLTPEEIAALPTNPEELEEALRQLIGGDLEILVDGFEGGRLPPGLQIQDVKIIWDPSANSGSGGPRVEIRTNPVGSRWRTSADLSVRDESLNARNAFAREDPVGQTRDYAWTLAGPVFKDKTGLSLWLDGSSAFEQQTVRAASPGGLFSTLVQQPSNKFGIWLRINQTLNRAQQIQVDVARSGLETTNLGVGEFDLPERAYSQERTDHELRVAHHATVRGRAVNDLRFRLRANSLSSTSASHATTVRVLDAFVGGGAQIEGGRTSREFQFEDVFEFTLPRRHELNAGFTVDGAVYRGDESQNANGTFTFASLAAFEAGRPMAFVERVGDPRFEYSLNRYRWYVQDNHTVRPGLLLNLGLRQELQTQLDGIGLSPRIGASWTIPGTKTTLRTHAGVFHQTLSASMYEQTLLVNGRRQHDVVFVDPAYPHPFAGDAVPVGSPAAIIRASGDLQMPSVTRVSVGVVQPLVSWATFRATYIQRRGEHQFRSLDVNAPVDGRRPDPMASTITELQSTARSRGEALDLRLSVRGRRHLSTHVNYTLGRFLDETDGPFGLPPTANLAEEWGPSRQDIRHRLNAWLTSDLWAALKISANARALSAAPYTVTTGIDSNGDGVNNERPFGVGRNSVRGAKTTNLDLTLTWGHRVGQRRGSEGTSGASRAGSSDPANALVRLELFVRATNVFNAVNAQGFSGVLTSPFFGQPTAAAAPRRIVLGLRLWL